MGAGVRPTLATRRAGEGFNVKASLRTGLVAAALSLALVGTPLRASAGGTAREVGLGVGSAISNFFYGPLKMGYAIIGTGISGLAWVFTGGSRDVAGPIFYASVRGDYVITPEHLSLEVPLDFVGRDPEAF
jgi:hypothetical protein